MTKQTTLNQVNYFFLNYFIFLIILFCIVISIRSNEDKEPIKDEVFNLFETISEHIVQKNFNCSKSQLPEIVSGYLNNNKLLTAKDIFSFCNDKTSHKILSHDYLTSFENPIHQKFFTLYNSYQRNDFELKKGEIEMPLIKKLMMKSFKLSTKNSNETYDNFISFIADKQVAVQDKWIPHQFWVNYCSCQGIFSFYCDNEANCERCHRKLTKYNSLQITDPKEQIAILLSDPKIEKKLLERQKINVSEKDRINEEKLDKHEIKDVYDSFKYDALRKTVHFESVNLGLTFTIWNDEIAIKTDKGKKKALVIKACINELPAEIRMKKEYLLTLMTIQNRGNLNSSAYQIVATVLQDLIQNSHTIEYFHYCVEDDNLIKTKNSLTIRGAVFNYLNDKGISPLNLKSTSGYFSCSTCMIVGHSIKKTMCFPFKDYDKRSARRTVKFWEICLRYNQQDFYCGFGKEKSPFIDIISFDSYSSTMHCSMHDFSGIASNFINKSSKEEQQKIKSLSVLMKYPSFLKVSRFNHSYSLGSEDHIKYLIYQSTIMMDLLKKDRRFIKTWSKLTYILEHILSKHKILTVGKIVELRDFARQFIEEIVDHFSDEVVTIKLHSLPHVIEQILSDGPTWCHNGSLYESTFKSLKIPGHSPTRHIIPALSTYIDNLFSLNLFSHLESSTFKKFNFSKLRRGVLTDLFEQDTSGEDRVEREKVVFKFGIKEMNIKSASRKKIKKEKLVYTICIDQYSRRKNNNNQFIILNEGNTKTFGKIIAIDDANNQDFVIYYLELIHEDKPFLFDTMSRVHKFPLNSNKIIKKTYKSKFEAQCFGCEIDGFIYCTEII